ncbi:FMN-dependent NADH-azoreductase [Paraburkholderia tropica]|uniref:FMN-dependent NADH-azoreductase n=1 Tax=Paraburkholderia tropica TaxID=92647 RepID=UPI00161D954B|nr:NAD(P)H-dependent oxidoreductase [Paraburkholderia tropica]MBB3003991.1 FMN-dependent NADH-azoreductase [Paraburkholderia tropica]MBB6323413.1 FMN-dependent NADH-azoreductase [Paraburkholderia tropica]
MKILHIDSSILEQGSASRLLSEAIVNELRAVIPSAAVEYRDLVADAIPHLDGAIASGFRQLSGASVSVPAGIEHARSEALVSEFLLSDIIVLGVPMYNFSVPSQLKTWIDRVAQPGRTFKYTENGPVGLSGNKAVIVASTRGGLYSSGPWQSLDFQEAYLTAMFGFLGIKNVKFVRAELLSKGPELRNQGIQNALAELPGIVGSFDFQQAEGAL